MLYADDAELQTLIMVMKDDFRSYRHLWINTKKAKVLVFEREVIRTEISVMVDDVVPIRPSG